MGGKHSKWFVVMVVSKNIKSQRITTKKLGVGR